MSNGHCGPGTMSYVIMSGDTFFSLANRFNTTVDAIMMANPGVDPNRLFIGQVICIPTTTPPPTTCPMGSQPYTIRSGDTLYNLAIRFNTTVDAILRINPGIDPNNLRVGQVICIPTTAPPPTQPCPTLRLGSTGPAVTDLQRRLLSFGFNPGPIDGIFGNQTQSAVIAFQRSRGLVVDGIVGVQTWTALGVNCGTTPPPTTCPMGSQPYTIRAGDTIYNLANRFNTTVDAILRINPGINPNNLQIGQVICIPR
ncbi:MAG: LysM peptidoglycan-binding domain-containing protein [Tissierellaceae bacterium]|nr:LysM peptidoglycan-binding domain-containing protein [Tissierellaceae bacterium]